MKNGFLTIILFLLPAFRMFGGDPSSVMASGDWYKITVDRDGIYRITYSELVSLGITDPANVRIYGSGGAMLPERADENSGNDLQEIPIWMYTGNDGIFNSGDYILFYGQGPAIWRYNKEKQAFEHSIHLWDNQSCYFITSKAGGKRITTETPPSASPSQTVTSFDEHQYHEAEQVNLIKSGRYWYGENFRDNSNPSTTYRFPFTVPDIETSAAAWLNISFMAQTSSSAAHLVVKCSNQQVADQPLPVSTGYQVATATTFNTSTFNPSSNSLSVELTVSYSGGWLDYIRLFARRKLNMASQQLFSGIRSRWERGVPPNSRLPGAMQTHRFGTSPICTISGSWMRHSPEVLFPLMRQQMLYASLWHSTSVPVY